MAARREWRGRVNMSMPIDRQARTLGALVAGVALLVATGCATASAREGAGPGLRVPAPPERVEREARLAPPEPPPADEADAAADAPATPAESEPARPDAAPPRDARPAATTSSDTRPEPEGAEVAETAGERERGETATLRLAEPGDADPVVVSRVISRSEARLALIDAASLPLAGREQHATATRFLAQARAALEAGNPTFASYLAEKAAVLVRTLNR